MMVLSDRPNGSLNVYLPRFLDSALDCGDNIRRTCMSVPKQYTQQVPIERSEEEIDRMWEYLKLMGRG